MNNTYVSFKIYRELYAVEVEKVLEVLEKQEITEVPNAPDVIMGIINFRGEVVPVFDTRLKFNLPQRDEDSYVIVVIDLSTENENYRMGAIVDRVKNVIEINSEEIKPVPPMSSDFNTDFLKGVVKTNDEFIFLLDIEKVFFSSGKPESIEATLSNS